MKTLNLLFLLFAIFVNIFSIHANTELKDNLTALSEAIQTVKTKNATYEQVLEWDENRPYKLSYTVVEIDKRDREEEAKFVFNLADFNVNTVRWADEKDKIVVTLTADNRQKSIKLFEDGEQQNYIDRFQIVAKDADNGRTIEELFREAIPIGTKLSEAELQLNSFEERKDWLVKNIVDFSIEEANYEQFIETKEAHPSLLQYSLTTPKGKYSQQEKWLWNMADISPQSIQLEVKNKEVFVEMKTHRNQKFIQYFEENQLDNYTNSLQIYAPEIDIARHLMVVLKDLAEESEKKKEAQLKIPSTEGEILQFLQENIKDVSENENQYKQEFEAACLTSLQTTGTEKDKAIDDLLTFHLADLDEKELEVDVRGTSIWIKTQTRNKQPLIEVKENDELEGYEKDFVVRASDVENAKALIMALEVATKSCKENLQYSIPEGGASEQYNWLSENIPSFRLEDTEYSQSLEKMEDASCKWEFNRTLTDKDSEEEIFQFSLKDIDPQQIDFKISRKELGIYIETNDNEKLIKYFKDGEPDDYQDDFLIYASSIEQARNIIESFKRAIEDCKN